jgi:hypothetical protein
VVKPGLPADTMLPAGTQVWIEGLPNGEQQQSLSLPFAKIGFVVFPTHTLKSFK